jgi:flagellar hook-basal body complex protein FliE
MNQSVLVAINALAGDSARPPGIGRSPEPAAQGFGESLGRLVEAVEASGADANAAVTRMVEGQGDVPEAMIALQRADLTFQFAVQVRNKLVQAYQDIMRMPI